MFEYLESSLASIAGFLKLILEGVSVLCVFLGLNATIRLILFRRSSVSLDFVAIRICFGTWLALALEFQLGADILSTTIAPTFETLGQLGATALIRTFLNYFLNKELEAEAKIQNRVQDIN
jgi:uncharacterized membrane protein